jgi:hypothetical protein
MTRKLAVTVFAMSLTLVGCGSSSTTKPDVGADTKITPADVAIKLDVVSPVDVTPVKLDVAAPTDVTLKQDVAPDITTTTPDGANDVTPVKLDGGLIPDAGDAGSIIKLDVAGSEVIKTDASDAAKVDAPEAGSIIDAPAVDAGAGDAAGEAGSDASAD